MSTGLQNGESGGTAVASSVNGNGSNNSRFESRIKYDIKAAAMRQGAFYYQVSLPHYRYGHHFFLVDNSFDIFALYLYIPPPKSITITRLSDYFICVKVLIVNQTESKKSCACGHTFFFTTETLTS